MDPLIKELLDKYLILDEDFVVGTFDWLPGYIVKRDVDHTRIANAKFLQDKIDKLGLVTIKIPQKYPYKDFVIAQFIEGHSGFNSQKRMSISMMRELHQLIAEGPMKYYDMITRNWMITDDGYLYIIDTDDKCIPKTIEDRLFYEASWFLLGDIITGHGGCYMNRRINHPWQLLVRGCYSKHSTYTQDVYLEIIHLFEKDVSDRLSAYHHYQQLVCDILNCAWSTFSGKNFDPNSMAIQLATGLYLSNLDEQFKEILIAEPHLLKYIVCKVQACGYDEFKVSTVPPITYYEIDDFQKYLTLAEQI